MATMNNPHEKGHTMGKNGTLSSLPTHIDMVTNILALYDAASGEEVQQGLTWYDEARDFAKTLAAGTGYSVAQCAGVIAALSPQAPWATNKAWARRMVDFHADTVGQWGAEMPAVSTTTNRVKAYKILAGEGAPLEILRGVKVTAFYRNIMGDADVVTVDLWAWYAATGNKLAQNEAVAKSANAPVQAAYIDAATARGITASAMQAVVWVAARGKHD